MTAEAIALRVKELKQRGLSEDEAIKRAVREFAEV
jgi:hypothetical protein